MSGRNNFSHALEAKVKKIIRKNLAARQLAEGGSASPKTQILGGERIRQPPDQRVEDNAFHPVLITSYGRGGGVACGLGVG